MKYLKKLILIIFILLSSCASNVDKTLESYQPDTAYIQEPITEIIPENIDEIEPITLKKVSMTREFLSDSIISEYHNNKIGDITHIIRDTMRYGVTDTVELTVSYNTPVNFLIERVGTFNRTRHDNLITQSIKITPIMEAKLIDPTNNSFEIVPITDQTQLIEFEDYTFTIWQWRVTPLAGGKKDLILNVNMVVGSHNKSIKIYEDKIYIHITPMDKFWIWMKTNWTYLTYLVGLITALFGFIYKEKILQKLK